MSQCFITLTPARERNIRGAKIPFEKFTNEGEKGILFERRYLDRVLRATRSEIADENDSSYSNIAIVSLARARRHERSNECDEEKPESVRYGEWDCDHHPGDMLEIVSKEYFGKLGVDEIILNAHANRGHDKVVSPQPGPVGTLRIHIWSSTVQGRNEVVPSRLWNIQIDSDIRLWYVRRSSGIGVIFKDGAGTEVAELIGEDLYIFYPLHDWRFPSPDRIYGKILKAVADEIGGSKAEREARRASRREALIIESRAAYVKACKGRFALSAESARANLESSERRARDLQKELVKCIREAQNARATIRQMETEGSGKSELYGKEYDKLRTISKVNDIFVRNNVIEVYTKVLNCQLPETPEVYEIGAFCIEMHLDGTLCMRNLTRQIDGCDHPHVSGGTPCLGNMQEALPELIANHEYAAVAMLAIQFIESCNPDGVHLPLEEWPLAR